MTIIKVIAQCFHGMAVIIAVRLYGADELCDGKGELVVKGGDHQMII